MKVLVVEDDAERVAIFRTVFAGHTVAYAKRAHTAVTLLGIDTFDLVMLDHDLEDVHYGHQWSAASIQDALEMEARGLGTGQQVAHAIVRLSSPPLVVVHSWNPTGARAIMAILAERGVRHIRYPFSETIGDDLRAYGVL